MLVRDRILAEPSSSANRFIARKFDSHDLDFFAVVP
jgi:hypothetical protein